MLDPAWCDRARTVLTELGGHARSLGRADLANVARTVAAGLDDGPATVVVVGGHQRGKTSLVGALVGAPIAPAGPLASTATTTVVAPGPGVAIDTGSGALPLDVEELPAALDRVQRAAAADPGATAMPIVFLPSPLLEQGIVLVDTPGCPGWTGGGVTAALSALPIADAALLLCPATQPMTAADIELAAALTGAGQLVHVVLTKADLVVDVATVAAANRDALAARGIDATTMSAVSTPLRWWALEAERDDLDAESGYDRLVDWLLDDVCAPLAALRRNRAIAEARQIVASLRAPVEVELRRLAEVDDPLVLQQLAAAVRQSQRDASRWNQELTDHLGDLRNACEVDIRQRAQALTSSVDERLRELDPAEDWERFRGWLDEAIATEMTEHLRWRHERLTHLVEVSAEEIAGIVDRAATAAGEPHEAGSFTASAPKRVALRTSLYGSLRSSYGGMAMFGFLGGMAGFALSLPVSLGIGVLLGGKSLVDERKKALAQRRTAARSQAIAHIDATFTRFGTDARAQLVALQRTVRAELGAVVDRLVADRTAAYEAARSAAAADRVHRRSRGTELSAALTRLDAATRVLDALAAAEPATGAPPLPPPPAPATAATTQTAPALTTAPEVSA